MSSGEHSPLDPRHLTAIEVDGCLPPSRHRSAVLRGDFKPHSNDVRERKMTLKFTVGRLRCSRIPPRFSIFALTADPGSVGAIRPLDCHSGRAGLPSTSRWRCPCPRCATFTPYTVLPHLDRYQFKVVNIDAIKNLCPPRAFVAIYRRRMKIGGQALRS